MMRNHYVSFQAMVTSPQLEFSMAMSGGSCVSACVRARVCECVCVDAHVSNVGMREGRGERQRQYISPLPQCQGDIKLSE